VGRALPGETAAQRETSPKAILAPCDGRHYALVGNTRARPHTEINRFEYRNVGLAREIHA